MSLRGSFMTCAVTALAALGFISDRSLAYVHHTSIPSLRTSSLRGKAGSSLFRRKNTSTVELRAHEGRGVPSAPSTEIAPRTSRRDVLTKTALTSGATFLSFFCGASSTPLPAWGASTKKQSKEELEQLETDKQKILAGYKRINYLLDNWKKETTVCGKRGNNDRFDDGCDRTPEKVMEYLGYKSMNDPLFKAEKRLFRLQSLVSDSDIDAQMRYQDALEKFSEKADEGTGMAFVSSWGEANPGGGKDRVELFIERSKNDVIEVRDSLKTILEILGLEQT